MSSHTKQCSNWYSPPSGQLISISSFIPHEAHCSRKLFKCLCGEVVSTADREAHEKQFHGVKVCPNCEFKGEAYVVDKHECSKKPKICEFCEGEICFDLYLEHIETCGNRTTPCPVCDKYVLYNELKAHSSSHSSQSPNKEIKLPQPPPPPRPYQFYTITTIITRPYDPTRSHTEETVTIPAKLQTGKVATSPAKIRPTPHPFPRPPRFPSAMKLPPSADILKPEGRVLRPPLGSVVSEEEELKLALARSVVEQ